MINEEIYKKTIEHWGEELQTGMLYEEIGELMVAVNKLRRKNTDDNKTNVTEEIADVYIMIEQIMILFNIEKMDVDIWKRAKLEKLEEMINGGEK